MISFDLFCSEAGSLRLRCTAGLQALLRAGRGPMPTSKRACRTWHMWICSVVVVQFIVRSVLALACETFLWISFAEMSAGARRRPSWGPQFGCVNGASGSNMTWRWDRNATSRQCYSLRSAKPHSAFKDWLRSRSSSLPSASVRWAMHVRTSMLLFHIHEQRNVEKEP